MTSYNDEQADYAHFAREDSEMEQQAIEDAERAKAEADEEFMAMLEKVSRSEP